MVEKPDTVYTVCTPPYIQQIPLAHHNVPNSYGTFSTALAPGNSNDTHKMIILGELNKQEDACMAAIRNSLLILPLQSNERPHHEPMRYSCTQ